MTTILLAEDNEVNRRMLVRFLGRAGYVVIEAVDGRQAVAIAREQLPDLILMDLSMPVLDGWAATRVLRGDADPDTRAVPIIALTGHAIQEELDRALQAGCDDVLTKPFEFAELQRLISSFIASDGG